MLVRGDGGEPLSSTASNTAAVGCASPSLPAEAVQPADRLYDWTFFQVFFGVVLFMTGASLQFHLGQYIEYLGHGVDTLGTIASIGMIGALLMRLRLGRWIDRFGCRPAFVVGSFATAIAIGSMQFAEQLWIITCLRTITTLAFAAVMTTVAVFAALIAPPHRRAECLGTIGLGGFVGMVIGPTLGDAIFSGATDTITPYRIFFSTAAGCSLLAGIAFGLAPAVRSPRRSTANLPALGGANGVSPTETDEHHSKEPSQIALIIAHWPGMILLIGIVFSMAFCWQSMFLERLAEARGFKDIKLFFMVYAPTAIVLRLVFRQLPQQIGRSRTLILGMVLMAVGQLTLIGVGSQMGLIVPALLMGAGHCFVFPSMVDLGAERFPLHARGTATAVILGMGDLGMIIGFAVLGRLIDTYGFDRALMVLAASVATAACVFAVARRKAVLRPRSQRSAAKHQ